MTYSIRPCQRREELAACVELQKEIWGYADAEVYPLRLFVNLTRIGGHALGAFTGRGQLVGFVAAMPAWRDGRRYLHSLSLGVAAGHRDRGLGRALKLAQREEALRAGVRLVEWTYDPMRAKNAFFNIVRLGAIARRYVPDYYGPVASRLQQGLPTDRLICEWWLTSKRVKRALEGKPARSPQLRPAAEVAIPNDFESLAERRPKKARALQAAVRSQFQRWFDRKLMVTDFVRGDRFSRYLLDPADDDRQR
jgi:predicted GNAT superfamily acetyltransferase